MNRDEELKTLEKAAELSTGKSVKYLRDTPICEQRMETEKKLGRSLKVTYGPNNKIYGPNRDEVNKMVDNSFNILSRMVDAFFYIRAKVNLVIVRMKIMKGK